MKKKQLEMLLQDLEEFSSPLPELEQYSTPAFVAAEILHIAYMRGDLRTVCDLGCGAGILAIGAALLGARVVAVEIDPQALSVARNNAIKLGVEVDFVLCDIASVQLRCIETVVMNPPFGAQKRSEGDRPFLNKAIEIAKVVYSLHNAGSEEFMKEFVKPCQVDFVHPISFPLKRSFQFHSKDLRSMPVDLYRIICD
jgi:putative methylase